MVGRDRNNQPKRSAAKIRDHYEIEKELAARLRNASRAERRTLYASVHEDLYRLVPDHPQLTRKASPEQYQAAIKGQIKLLKKLLREDSTFLEVGPGDCHLSFAVAELVKQVYAVDVSDTITRHSNCPENFQLFLSNGWDIPVPDSSVDVAYSNQLMEHLHPDDALDQLHNIFKALAPRGVYLCITPNRFNGPHDISKGFDTVASGFHLREYSTGELADLFREAGFSSVKPYIGFKGRFIRSPLFLVLLCETVVKWLPYNIRRRLAKTKPFRVFLATRISGMKREDFLT